MITHLKPFGNHGYPQGLSDLIFGDSDAKKARNQSMQAQSDNAARLARQEGEAKEKERQQQIALSDKRRATMGRGRSGRSLLLSGAETGVTPVGGTTGAPPTTSNTLG